MSTTFKARWNRIVSDARIAIAWKLFHLASWVTDASVHSHRGKHRAWDWKVSLKAPKD